MKKSLFAILVVSLCLMVSAGAFVPIVQADEEKQEKGKIVTNGESKVWLDPDRARIFLGIETMRETIDLARDENARKIDKVMQALKALKIKSMLIKAPSYNVSLVKERERDATKQGRLPKILGYKVRQDFTVLLKNEDVLILSKDAARAVDTALDNGVNVIQNINFFKEDESKERTEALELAVKDAISNAKTIAKTADISISDYTQINSTISYSRPAMDYMRQAFTAGEGRSASTTLVAGKISVSCKVTLHCSTE